MCATTLCSSDPELLWTLTAGAQQRLKAHPNDQALTPIKGHNQTGSSSLLLPLPCFRCYRSLWVHTERIVQEGKTSTKIILLHPSINMMENLPLHWRQWVSPLKGQYGQINYSLWCLSNQRHTVRKLVFSSVEATGSRCSFQSFFLLLRMVDMLSLNSCRYAEAFFSRACWKYKNSRKEGGDGLCQV